MSNVLFKFLSFWVWDCVLIEFISVILILIFWVQCQCQCWVINTTFHISGPDIISLTFSQTLVNTVCKIVWSHIYVPFQVSQNILYLICALYILSLEPYFQYRRIYNSLSRFFQKLGYMWAHFNNGHAFLYLQRNYRKIRNKICHRRLFAPISHRMV